MLSDMTLKYSIEKKDADFLLFYFTFKGVKDQISKI